MTTASDTSSQPA